MSPSTAPPIWPFVRRLVHAASRIGAFIAALTICVIALLTVTDVTRRGTVGQSLLGAIEIAEVALVIVVFLGLGFAEFDGMHVRATLLTSRLKGLARRITISIGQLVACLVLGFFAVASLNKAIASVAANEIRTGIIGIPIWPGRIAVAVGFFLFFLEAVLVLVDSIAGRTLKQFGEVEHLLATPRIERTP